MKSVQVVARGKAEFVDVPKPEVAPGKIVIRTAYLALCGSDIQMLHYAAESSYPFPPGTTGHEIVGYVEAVGDADSEFKVGDRVLSLAPGHLAMCEWFLADANLVVPLPDNQPMEVLLQAQQLGTVIYGSQYMPPVEGKTVAVIGQGSAGLWFNFHMKRLGAKKVIALDIEQFRLELSEKFGADHAFNNSTTDPMETIRGFNDGELADVVVEAAGEVESINLAIDLVKKYGNILYFGYPRDQTFMYNFNGLYHKCCHASTIVGASNEPNLTSLRAAIDLVASGEAMAADLITHRVKFSETIDAYEMHRTRADGAVKIVIEMPGA
ncbi:MAG: zinc-binding dehydrogenase [Planctomycetales bacterium]|nr:zinc-binding dehydrogenase [Planctomycetales bacterium]